MRIECDMCGAIYDKERDTTVTPSIVEVGMNYEYHLCPKCGGIIINMIKHHK